MVHLPSVVARLGETEYPDAYGGLTDTYRRAAQPRDQSLITCWT